MPSLIDELDEAIDAGAGDTVLVTQDLLCRVHADLVKLERHRDLVNLADTLRRLDKLPTTVDSSLTWQDAKRQFARSYFRDLLERCGGNKSEASRVADIDRKMLHRYLKGE